MSSSHLILIDLSCSDCLTERPCARSGVCEDSVCVPHSSTLRIKSFDSLNTQSRSSKLLQPQYRSLVSYHDDSNDGRHNTKLILECIPRSLSVVAHTLPVFSPQDMSEGSGCGHLLVKARFAFQQTNEDELSFSKGDIISVSRQEDGGWWEGSFNGKSGWFPSNYVRELKGSGGWSVYSPHFSPQRGQSRPASTPEPATLIETVVGIKDEAHAASISNVLLY